jgi:hypothetical protein
MTGPKPQMYLVVALVAAAIVFFLPNVAATGATDTRNDEPAPSSAPTSSYVGSETCKTCHEEIFSAWEKTPHRKTTLK